MENSALSSVQEEYFDTVIIGGGPAGVSASLYIQRANLNSAVFYGEKSSLFKAEKIENFYGFYSDDDFNNSGQVLFERGLKQAQSLGAKVFKDECVGLSYDFEQKLFLCDFENTKTKSKTVILATGSSRKKPSIKNLDVLEGKGVSYCAVCDSFFYRQKDVCVIGSGNYAFEEANVLLNVANSVTLLSNGENLETQSPNYKALIDNDKFKVIDKKILQIDGVEKTNGVTFEDGSSIECAGVFIALGIAGADALARKIGAAFLNSKIVTNENMETSISGLFAAGDCTSSILQVARAVSDGCTAGLNAIKFCKKNKL